MDFTWEERPSDSPLVATVWRSQHNAPGAFTSIAQLHYGLVVTRTQDSLMVTVRGPETRPSLAYNPPEAEFFGILLKPGVFMPNFPAGMLMDRRDVHLPIATGERFWLGSSTWEVPDYDNVETFINWLVRDGLLVHDPVVEAVMQGQRLNMSLRTVQRRFLQATGLTQDLAYQIQRARYATTLLKRGGSILDTVEQAGYFDQPHLTRSLKRFIGQTPAQVADQARAERVSILYKTPTSLEKYAPLAVEIA